MTAPTFDAHAAGPRRRVWLRDPLAVWTGDPSGHSFDSRGGPRSDGGGDAGGGVVVESSLVAELVPTGGRPSEACAEVVDCSAHVLLPGLVNTHHHFYQTLTRAWGPVIDTALFDWLQRLYPVWARITPRDLELAVTVAAAELLLSGCTTAADHHYLFPAQLTEAIDVEVATLGTLGLRAVVTRGSMSLGRDQGGLPPQSTVQDPDVIMADCERVVDRYHQAGEGAMVQVALAPCSPFSVTRQTMIDSAELARARGLALHTHLAETLDEEDFCRERFGLRTVDYLESVGWLEDRTWLAHGIHFDDDEVARLGAAGVGVAHCPSSNMRLASGIARAVELEDAGCAVGLGVDGSASNDHSNLMVEARQALLLQRLRYGAEAVSPARALGWATRGSARALGRDDLGVIAPGRPADLALFRLDEPAFSGSHDPVAALLLCGAHRADRVMVDGRWRVTDGAVVGLDLPAVLAEHGAAARRLVAAG
ncbi:8-oxoguanine deaminase [Friedmanniella endophytica]|uniref:8-oxoguanine deaminase n=1 Tax=Microlunatus kandeliicorticis TaxID=1759536 RepID=A0A7W3IVH4_9ACTN|nr:8-oxoguanine deaminase [Microlunatus kandeliicorticis]MBA8796031.1 8-oxoguanine deaminase [Microlunatus kandeliicorticis]